MRKTDWLLLDINHIQVIINLSYLGIIRFEMIQVTQEDQYLQSCINEKPYSVVKMAGKSVF